MSQGSSHTSLQAVRHIRLFAIEIVALILVLAWLFVGVPHVCGLFRGHAGLMFAAGCVAGLPAWAVGRRFVHRSLGELASVLLKSLVLLFMGGLVFADALFAWRLQGSSLLVAGFASGVLVSAGTATVAHAWCTALTSHASRDVEVVGMVSLLANAAFAAFAAFVPQASMGLVVGCPILAWALLVAMRSETMSRGQASSGVTAAAQPVRGERACLTCRFAHGPLPLLVSLVVAFTALGFLGEVVSGAAGFADVRLQLLECLLTCLAVLVAVVLFRAHSPRVDLPSALPWVTLLAAASLALCVLGDVWPAVAGSSVFTAALALATFSTLTLVTGGFGASPRCACTRVARPDVAIASAVGGYVVGCVAAGCLPLQGGAPVQVAAFAAIVLLAGVSAFTARMTRRRAVGVS